MTKAQEAPTTDMVRWLDAGLVAMNFRPWTYKPSNSIFLSIYNRLMPITLDLNIHEYIG